MSRRSLDKGRKPLLDSNLDTIDSSRRPRSKTFSLPNVVSAVGNLRSDHRRSDASDESVSSLKKLLYKDSQELLDSTDSKRRFSFTSPKLSAAKSNDSTYDEFELTPIKDAHVKIPQVLLDEGMSLLKVSQNSKKRIFFQVDPQTLCFNWKVANKSFPSSASMGGFQKLLQSAHSHSSYLGKLKVYKFYVDDVRKVWYQLEGRHFRDELNISREFENQWISISYYNEAKKKIKILHLIADTEQDSRKFYSSITNLRKLKAELAENFYVDLENIDSELKKLVSVNTNSTPKKAKEYLSFDEIVKYIERLGINISKDHLKSIFDGLAYETRVNDITVVNFEEFKGFIAVLKRRMDIEEIWAEYSLGSDMAYEDFCQFVQTVQGESFDNGTKTKIYEKFSAENGLWNVDSFNQFLLSKYSKPIVTGEYDASYYDHPISEYFISSSHNTYLIGKQVADLSSAEGYVRALQKGCRCIEIDLWDGHDPVTDEVIPVVCHGRAFTTSISLPNVLSTIKRYAFVASPYPLILSLEVKCSPEAQFKIVEALLGILGQMLVTKPLRHVSSLPSPNDLKHRILIKAKKTSPLGNVFFGENGTFMSSSTTSTSFSEDNLSGSNSSLASTSSSSSRRRGNKKIVIDELSDMAVYVQGIKFRNFSLPESKMYNHCFSLGERTIDSMLKDTEKTKAIDKHNRRYLMRVYPSGMRLRSSNFDPIKYWVHGTQMVATNWQTYDQGQQINEALFDGKNKSGYYLKPTDIRSPLLKQTLRNILHLENKKYRFDITIISAHQLPKPKLKDIISVNPFVKFEIKGASDLKFDKESCSECTSVVNDNGFNPIWNEKFSGTMVANELLFIKLSLFTMVSKDEPLFLGGLVCRLENLKQGYRYLALNDSLGEELIYSSLFVKLMIYEI